MRLQTQDPEGNCSFCHNVGSGLGGGAEHGIADILIDGPRVVDYALSTVRIKSAMKARSTGER